MRVVLVALLALLWADSAFAWGRTGHRVTGAIAERFLSAQTRAAVREILDPETLAEASTWADEMRASPDPFWRERAGAYHYVTVPDGKSYAQVGAPAQGDAVTALREFAVILRDPNASLADRQRALRFAIHIIGDLHQPLHVGNGRDRGGNDIKVHFFGRPTNLHRVWDSGIIDREQLSFSEWASWLGARITPQQAVRWAVSDPLVWIAESARIRSSLYPEQTDIGWRYVLRHKPVICERLAQAGVRIAAWLNAVFAGVAEERTASSDGAREDSWSTAREPVPAQAGFQKP